MTIRSKPTNEQYEMNYDRVFRPEIYNRKLKERQELSRRQAAQQSDADWGNDVNGTVTQVWHEGE